MNQSMKQSVFNTSNVEDKLSLFEHQNKMMSLELDRYQKINRDLSKNIPSDTKPKYSSLHLSSVGAKNSSFNLYMSTPVSPTGRTLKVDRYRTRNRMSLNATTHLHK